MSQGRALPFGIWLLVTVLACDGDTVQDDGWYFSDLPSPEVVESESAPRFQLTEVSRFGTEDGPGALGRIAAVAARDDLIAVADAYGCDIVLFARATRAVVRRFGGCGDGPGEFRNIVSLQFHRDSLLVADRAGARLRVFTDSGTQVRTIALDTLGLDLEHGAHRVFLVGDEVVASAMVGSWAPGRAGSTATDSAPRYVRTVSLGQRGEASPAHLLRDGREPLRASAVIRHIPACVVGGARGVQPHVVAMNAWVPQLVSFPLGRTAVPTLNMVVRDIPQAPIAHPQKPGEKMPSDGVPNAACGNSLGLVTFRRWRDSAAAYDRRNPTPPDEAFLVAVWPHDGRWATAHFAGEPTAFLGTAAAIHDDAVFFTHGMLFPFPVVVETRLRVSTP